MPDYRLTCTIKQNGRNMVFDSDENIHYESSRSRGIFILLRATGFMLNRPYGRLTKIFKNLMVRSSERCYVRLFTREKPYRLFSARVSLNRREQRNEYGTPNRLPCIIF